MHAGPAGPAAPARDRSDPAALADVLRMLDRLPLTDAERAEAIRRLLAADAGKGNPR